METKESPVPASVCSLESTWGPGHWDRVWKTPWLEERKRSHGRRPQLEFIAQSIRRGPPTDRALEVFSVPLRIQQSTTDQTCLWGNHPGPREEPSEGLEGRGKAGGCPPRPQVCTALLNPRALGGVLRKIFPQYRGSYLVQLGIPTTLGT